MRSSRVNYFWETAFSKFLPKRHSQGKEGEPPRHLERATEINELTDGFYMYSQSLLEEEAKKREAAMVHQKEVSDSSDNSFASALVSQLLSPSYMEEKLTDEIDVSCRASNSSLLC